MSFMNNVNQTISDNLKFLKQYKANPQSIQGTTPTTAGNAQMQQLMPMILMMMFQMLSQMGALGGQTASTGAYDPFAGLPTTVPIQPNMNPDPERQIQQNPAYQFLSGKLTDTTASAPDFTDKASLIAHMNTLLSSSPDSNLQKLANQLGAFSPDSSDLQDLRTQVESALKLEGRSDADIAKFDLLFVGIQNNNSLAEFQIRVATNPTTANPQAVQQLTQIQKVLAQQWQQFQPVSTTTPTAQDLNQQVKAALAAKQFTPVQLGQSLKYLLDTAPESSMGALSSLTTSLMKSGDLNIIPFLQGSYLNKLTPARQIALLNAVQDAGLMLNDGKPNTRFAGFLLENISDANAPASTKAFLQHFLQNEWLEHAQTSNTAEAKAIINMLDLAALQHKAGQPLTFS